MSDWRNRFSSPSKIDNFAMYLTNSYWGRKDQETGEDVEFTDELFVNELLKKFEKTPEMKAGIALHKILEQSKYCEIMQKSIIIDNEEFNFEYELDEHLIIIVPQLREQKIQKTFGNIIINGILDGVNATTVWDHKLTKQIKYEKYYQSWQWKIYLWMTRLNYFKYNVFQGKIKREFDLDTISGGNTLDTEIAKVYDNIYNIKINKFEMFDFEKCANMDNEVENFYLYYWEVLYKLKSLIIETAHTNNIIIKGLTI